jgi:hypothetical protein
MNFARNYKNGTFKFMDENVLLLVYAAGVLVLLVLIILFANWMDNRMKKKQRERMRKDMENGTYDPYKKYSGQQGNREPADDPGYYNDNNRVN